MIENLLPCPFCGGSEPYVVTDKILFGNYVWCPNCTATGSELPTPLEAATCWNRVSSLNTRAPCACPSTHEEDGDAEELKPCPVCGSDDLSSLEFSTFSQHGVSNTGYAVECEGCSNTSPRGKDWNECIANWNNRIVDSIGGEV